MTTLLKLIFSKLRFGEETHYEGTVHKAEGIQPKR